MTFLTIILSFCFLSSAIILSKYIDFAKFMIERKEKEKPVKVIQFSHPKPFKKRPQENIIIDIPIKDTKFLNNDN